jgi:hypothetical protein
MFTRPLIEAHTNLRAIKSRKAWRLSIQRSIYYVPTLEMSSHLREQQYLKIMPATSGVY